MLTKIRVADVAIGILSAENPCMFCGAVWLKAFAENADNCPAKGQPRKVFRGFSMAISERGKGKASF